MEEIISQILSEVFLPKLVKEKVKPKRALKTWEIVLLVLGFLLWFPLPFVILVVTAMVYLTIWIIIMMLYIIDLVLVMCAAAGAFYSVFYIASGQEIQVSILFCAQDWCLQECQFCFFSDVIRFQKASYF